MQEKSVTQIRRLASKKAARRRNQYIFPVEGP
ncbi:hypothetical protein CRE_23578 [Caenorhabditis remanei]|uniref:Uncharacterized protein n=1 Tax=Caenorhabditis remanei TaxID=31234 RepID=E3MVW5_CAERE|nr:hypothetical protein CRE_23578 [Caenorhabditis remanei]